MNRLSNILIQLALEEDLAQAGDLTSQHFVDPNHRSIGAVVSREDAVISGHEIAKQVCHFVDPSLVYDTEIEDGNSVHSGEVVATISGSTQSILTAERTLLNFMQRLSGVATIAAAYVKEIAHTKARLLDTRKTTPGWRELEKKAVVHGGATNHRIGLYDAIMVKDNHLVANSEPVDLRARVSAIKAESPDLKIEFEADRLDQLEDFLTMPGVDVVLLDNMSNEELQKAVQMRDAASSSLELEASGGVNLETIRGIAETGVDYISVGALTHSVRSIDLGLDLRAAE